MKKYLLIILFIILFSPLYGYDAEIKYIREQFYLAVEDEDALNRLEEFIVRKYSPDISVYPPVILAYRGGVEALKAKYVFSPFSKFSYVIESLDILDTAVKNMPGSLEVRFIRFSILDNIPFFLGYGEERESDKKVIISELLRNDFSSIDKETQGGLIDYLLESSSLTDDEKYLLKSKCIAYQNK